MADNDLMSRFLSGDSAISSKNTKVVMRRNGQIRPLIACTKFKAKSEKKKEDVKTLGNFVTRKKYVGWSGSGTIGGYVIDSELIKNEIDSLHTGKETRFSIISTIYGNDAQGEQVIQLSEVSLDDVPFADLESDDGLVEYETDYSFEDVELLQSMTGNQAQ
ncbi:phage tail protein [Apilactobacillus micheneri]|uniref:phage tail tube protein n=1 Tax=Apilactobacillus micheneri TaxID=1899430 RepID=UPI00112EAD06|nr:phage tail tube protein [Apilactobacillus micheneri]TPR41274.1 phage tail protein [Apilactobacillus micheneri]